MRKTYFYLLMVVALPLAVLAGLLAVGRYAHASPSARGIHFGVSPGGVQAAEAVTGAIPIQGQLTDEEGNPLNGTYEITMRLYDSTAGDAAPLCQEVESVTVENGLFNVALNGCTGSQVDGRQLYLGIQVGDDDEMTPRQPIYPVPYAWSLRPGALISDTRDVILTVRSTGSGDSDALLTYASDEGEAVTAYAEAGAAIAGFSEGYVGIQGYSNNQSPDAHPGIFGCVAATNSECDGYRGVNASGVMGYSDRDFGLYGLSGSSGDGGVYAEGRWQLGVGLWAENNGGGMAIYAEGNAPAPPGHAFPTLFLVQQDASGDFVVGANSYLGTRYWRVDRTGRGYFNGGTQSSGADFAEQMPVQGDEDAYEVGDVLVISPDVDRAVELSTQPFSTAVIGVYSTNPAVLAGAPDSDDPLKGIPVAIVGIVPCKVSAENGAIQRGDLLVTSSTPGHAMRAGENPPQGTVLGKALQPLEEGTGVILILVTLQ